MQYNYDLLLFTVLPLCKSLFTNNMVADKKQRKKKNLTTRQVKTYLKIVFDDEQAEHLAVQNGTVLGIIGRYECCWF